MDNKSNPLKPIIDLAKAREFLILYRDLGNVPPLGRQEREAILHTLDDIMLEALQATGSASPSYPGSAMPSARAHGNM